MISIAASFINFRPLVDTITGSYTTCSGRNLRKQSAIALTVSSSLTIPILTASGCKSSITASICPQTISAGTTCTARTPTVFCTVTAVMADAAYPPKADMVLMSACIPAPPEQSEPAMERTTG